MANWLDKYEQGGMVLKQKTKDNYGKQGNYNDAKVSTPPGYVGLGYNTKGRNYSPAWGGQFAMGGSIPGAVGFTYARIAGSAPSNGKYAKKTKASAQNGKELKNVKGKSEKFLKGWMDSPMYNKMINASINASPNQQEEIIKAISREDQLKKMSWEFADLNADKSWLDKLSSPILGQFVQDKNKVLLNSSSNNDTLSEVGVHEGSHATDLGGINIPRSDIEKMSKYKKEYEKQKGFFTKLLDDEDFNTYVGRPTETRARLNAIRYLGKKEGIYDPYKEKVDKDILKKLPSSIFHPTELDQLRLIYSDDQIIDLLNSVSKNDSNKSIPQAQNGKEMAFYQNGLDFKPKSISKNGSAIKDDRGQWAHPGEITEIGSNDITMKGVDYPVLGVSDTGDTQMMYPDQDYKFDGEKVTEYPMAQSGIIVNDLKNPRLKAYQDSLAAYNKSNDLYKQLLKMGREGNKGTREQVRDKMSLKEINYRGNVGMPYSYEGIKPDYVLGTRTPTENRGYLPHYKKPTQPVQYQAPKAEVKQIKGSKKYFINETEVDEPTFNKIVPKKEGMQNGGWLNKYK